MKPENMERLLRWSLVLALVALCAFFGGRGLQHYREYQHFREREAAMEARLESMREEYRLQQRYLQRLLNDPLFLEDVVRERLGYVRADEMLFRFPGGED